MTAPHISSSIRKAALLVVGLERATADALLARMPPNQADRIRAAVGALGEVDPREQQAVVEEFLRIGPVKAGSSDQKTENNDQPKDRLSSTHELPGERSAELPMEPANAAPATAASHQKEPPLAFLKNYDAADIAAVLSGEHSQTTAIVLSHLPARQAAEVLAQLSTELRGEVVDRLIGSTGAADDVLGELEAGLRTSLLGKAGPQRPTSAGIAVVQSILAAAERPLVDGIVDAVARHDHLLARRLRAGETTNHRHGEEQRRPISFDDLVDLDEADLDTLLHTVDADVLALALTGCGRLLLERILDRLPQGDRRRFSHALDHLGPTRLSDVEAARRLVGTLAQRLADEDRIALPGPRRLSVAA